MQVPNTILAPTYSYLSELLFPIQVLLCIPIQNKSLKKAIYFKAIKLELLDVLLDCFLG